MMLYERPDADCSAPVLILLPTLGVGGSETKFVRLVNALSRGGAPVHLGYFNPPETLRPDIDSGLPVVHLARRGKYSPASLRRLRDYVISRRIATLVTVNLYPLAYAVPLRALRMPFRPRIVASINTTHVADRRERFFMVLYRQLFRRVDQVVFGCRQQQGHWCSAYGLDRGRSAVIYNGVDGNRFDPAAVAEDPVQTRHRYGVPAGVPLVVSVGQMRPEKAQGLLIEALSRLQTGHGLEPHLLLVGEGSEREALEQLAAVKGLTKRVHFAGAVADVRPCLRAAEVFAQSSLSETFSNAALEAGAMAIPVVASDTGGAAEMFPGDEHGGLIYRTGDVDALATRLASLLEDPRHARSLGAQARHTVTERFSLERMESDWRRMLWPDGHPDAKAGRRPIATSAGH